MTLDDLKVTDNQYGRLS